MKSKVFYAKLKGQSQVPRYRDDTENICFDFKQNMQFPHLPTGYVFYLRQLWLFVLGVNYFKTDKRKMYKWPATQAKRGVNEPVCHIACVTVSSIQCWHSIFSQMIVEDTTTITPWWTTFRDWYWMVDKVMYRLHDTVIFHVTVTLA